MHIRLGLVLGISRNFHFLVISIFVLLFLFDCYASHRNASPGNCGNFEHKRSFIKYDKILFLYL